MIKKYIFYLFCFIAVNLNAQTIERYGAFYLGGITNNQEGAIFTIDDTLGVKSKYNFVKESNGSLPKINNLIQIGNKLYGTTLGNGSASYLGGIFSYDILTGEKLVEVNFPLHSNPGSYSPNVFLFNVNGIIYGVNDKGGNSGNGYIFKFNPNTKTFNRVYHFTSSNGSLFSNVVKSGNYLYGAFGSGIFGPLKVFRFNTQNNSIQAKGNFRYLKSIAKSSTLNEVYITTYNSTNRIQISKFNFTSNTVTPITQFQRNTFLDINSMLEYNNNLYGFIYEGGTNNDGLLFKINLTSNTFSSVFNFSLQSSGRKPNSLILGSDGNFYGGTLEGGTNISSGTIFKFNPNSNSYTKLRDMDRFEVGRKPSPGRFLEASNGKIYFLNESGNWNFGALTCFEIATAKFSRAANFESFVSGRRPYSNLSEISNNLLIGTTNAGGLNYDGIIYEYDYYQNTVNKLFDFNDTISGKTPASNLIYTNSKIYGLCLEGGANNKGTLFTYNTITDTLIVIHDFSSSEGIPLKHLTLHSNGKIYGKTRAYGSNQVVIFEIDPASDQFNIKLSYTRSLEQNNAVSGGFVEDLNGSLLSVSNGSSGQGGVFKYDLTLNTQSLIKSFSGNHIKPIGTPIIDSSGVIYGCLSSSTVNPTGGIYGYNSLLNSIQRDFVLNSNTGTNLSSYQPFVEDTSNLIFFSENGGPGNVGYFFNYNTVSKSVTKTNAIGNVAFADVNGSLTKVEYCRKPQRPTLTSDLNSICPGGLININVTAGNLFSGNTWSLFLDTNSSSIQNSPTGNFQISPMYTTTYFVKGEGQCFQTAPFDSILIIVDTNYYTLTQQNIQICKKSNFIKQNGDTVFNVVSDFKDSTYFISRLTGCDSIVVSNVTVDSIPFIFLRNNTTLTIQTIGNTYQWINCDSNQIIQGETSQSFTATQNGNYAVIINKAGCVDTSSCYSILSVGIENLYYKDIVEINPNPTNGILNIKSIKDFKATAIRIFDLRGKLLKQMFFNDREEMMINLEGESGIYFLELENNQGQVFRKKVLKY